MAESEESEEIFSDKLLRAAEEGEGRNGSDQTGCGWTKMTLLEDEDDRMRYRHNERDLGSDSR